MEINQTKDHQQQPAFNASEESSFNWREWIMRFLSHWYLFVATTAIALGIAVVQNLKWMPRYQTETEIMVENATSNSYSFMQGFSLGSSSYKNAENQLLLLRSRNLIHQTMEILPFGVDYFSQGRFKTRSLYGFSPIKVIPETLTDEAYGYTYHFIGTDSVSFQIIAENKQLGVSFKLEGRYGEVIGNQIALFSIERNDTPFEKYDLFFRFRSIESLTDEFAGRLRVTYIGESSSVINASIVSSDISRDRNFLDALAETYLNDNLEKKNREAIRTIDFIDEQLNYLSDSLAISEAELHAYRLANNIVDMSSYRSGLLSKLSSFEIQRQELRAKESYFNYLSRYLIQNVEDNGLMAPTSIGVADPALLALVSEYNVLVMDRAEKGVKHPSYERQTKQIELVKKQLLEVLKNVRAVYDIERKNFDDDEAKALIERQKAPEKEQRMIAYERKYRINDDYYTFLLQKRSEAQIRKASNTPDGSILQKARVTTLTNGKDKSQNYILYLFIGLLLPVIFLIIRELFNNTVRTVADIEKATKFPFIGTVRHAKSEDPVISKKYPKSVFVESLRLIRTRITLLLQRKTSVTLLITSVESGDGKTYFSANMSGVYGLTSRKTLLIDLDLHKPSLPTLLGNHSKLGLMHYIIGDASLDEVIQKRDEYGFDFLPVGILPPNPGELIRSPKLKDTIIALQERYDYIVIDTSPIGLVSDAYSLLDLVDLTIIVARSCKTNKHFFQDICGQLFNDKLTNIYIVLNDLDNKKVETAGYGYGYGYGSSYYGNSVKSGAYYGDADFEREEPTFWQKIFTLLLGRGGK